MPDQSEHRKRRWRFYRTANGHEPVRAFLDSLSDDDASEIVAVMKEITAEGMGAARHVRDEIYEARATGATQTFRILFATEGRFHHVLLALEGFSKKTRKTPTHEIELAIKRLADWRSRGQ
ncbi:MAG TPA: type II toxin-antitoxin system RelE/ParE family toxin [Ktedonobacterales bacterium]|nr:type II toxin-antitoxin system RelE/ParE family toxin [Ktedonobacterales bacterium]